MTEKILVSLGEGQSLQDLARGLLAVANDPHDVETAPRQGGFLVPEDLAGRYAVAAEEEGKNAPKLRKANSDTAADTETKVAKKAAPARSRRARADTAANAETKTAEPKTPAKKAAKRTASSRSKSAAKATPAAKDTEAKGKGDGGVSDA